MSPARIYKSSYPDYVIPRESVFTKLFPSEPRFDESLPAFIEAATGRTLSRGDVRDLSLRLGYGTRSLLNTKRGDTIMIFSPNSLVWPITLFGCVAAGLRCTLANSSYTPPELAHQLSDSRAGYVFVHPALLPMLFKAFEVLKVPAKEAQKRVIVMNFNEPAPKGAESFIQFDSLLKCGRLEGEERFDGDLADETVYLCYSSGTTGLSKGVETTHHNINTVLTIARAGFPGLVPGQDTMLGILPFYHIYGCVKVVQYPLTLGIPVVISPPFNPEEFCSYIQKYKITASLIVPPVLVQLASHPAVDKYDLSSLRFFFSGAAPLGPELTARVQKRLRGRGANVLVTQGYGLTETSPTCTLLPLNRAEDKVGSAGELLPNLEARLVSEDGSDAKDGEPGEFWLRGPSVMKGYLNNVKATENSITPDGWFKTGDIAVRDKEGFFTVVDRLKELIKYKGFQVPPADLENVLLTHPDIVDVGVIGVESVEQATELPRAYVVHKTGYASFKSQADREAFGKEVQAWIQKHVAKHKYLRGGVVVIEAIPKSPAGKILRRQLRDLAKKEIAASGVKAKL
ncbi:acetyl-CoA synthetase-like protein [Ceratobasidium sp. AG-I]|nr:acetyl-CoA synthetase-like protein [Ceratobasidium sp. AG-I]